MTHDKDVPTLCEVCGKRALFEIEPGCRACGAPVTLRAPNVQLVRKHARELEKRCEAARAVAAAADSESLYHHLEQLGASSAMVVSMSPLFAVDFMTKDNILYSPYSSQIEGGLRSPYSFEADRMRRLVDTSMYGQYGREITFGCLSSDGTGPVSYGGAFCEIDDVAIGFRATVVETNSWRMYGQGDEMLPGRASVWSERGRLVAAKMVEDCAKDATWVVPGGLRPQEGTRDEDEYFEVHVYGRFNSAAVRQMRWSSEPADSADALFRDFVREKAKENAILWEAV